MRKSIYAVLASVTKQNKITYIIFISTRVLVGTKHLLLHLHHLYKFVHIQTPMLSSIQYHYCMQFKYDMTSLLYICNKIAVTVYVNILNDQSTSNAYLKFLSLILYTVHVYISKSHESHKHNSQENIHDDSPSLELLSARNARVSFQTCKICEFLNFPVNYCIFNILTFYISMEIKLHENFWLLL